MDYTRISYWHKLVADDNRLQLIVSGGQQTTVSGFTNSAIRVIDVTNPEAAEEMVARVEPDRGVFSATFAPARSGERKLLAITDDGAERPAGVSANRASSLRAPNHTADLVIITRRDFFPAFEGLAKLRARQGIKSELIDAEDIYDEFNFGNKSPQAVKDFLQYAKTNWKRGPRFVLLGADSSYDPKNYLGFGDWDIAPSKLIDTALMETASDDWFVDFNNDGLPELAVGRLPARSLGEATAMVAKIIDYEHSPSSEEILLVADASDTYDFAQANASLKSLIPPNLRVNQIDRASSDPATARSLLLDAINRGHKLVGARIAPGKRTVTSALRVMGKSQEKHFRTYHRVLNRDKWSALDAARISLGLLVATFASAGVLAFGIDDTIERRRGDKIRAKGIYRDPVRSSHSHFVKASGLRWLCCMLLCEISWADRIRALPFSTVLCPPERSYRERGLKHQTLVERARQVIQLVCRWLPGRAVVFVADSSFAVIQPLKQVSDLRQASLITRLRMDAALYDAALYDSAPARLPRRMGRPRLKGARRETLEAVLNDPKTDWRRVEVGNRYGGGQREVEVSTDTAVWYHTGLPQQILSWFVRRWRMEVTFEGVRAHLGVETQRQRNDLASS